MSATKYDFKMDSLKEKLKDNDVPHDEKAKHPELLSVYITFLKEEPEKNKNEIIQAEAKLINAESKTQKM